MTEAKLVRYIPAEGKRRCFDKYEFECIECGTHYFRSANNSRVLPYCGECQRKHDREKQRTYIVRREQKAVDETLRKIKAEIKEQTNFKIKSKLDEQYQIGLSMALSIIDKYLKEGE